MERAVGNIFIFGNKKYKVIENDGCLGCSFYFQSLLCSRYKREKGECKGVFRKDKTNIIFVEISC